MKETRCKRCGKSVPLIADLCEDCGADLEEFMQGAPILKWNPVKVRELTREERLELIDRGYTPELAMGEHTMLDGFIPDDGQEILITVKGSHGKSWVEYDTACSDDGDSWLDSGRDWEDVTAWAVPEPYKGESEDKD